MDLQPKYARVIGAIILIIWATIMLLGGGYENIIIDAAMLMALSAVIIGIIYKEEIGIWLKTYVS